MQTNNKMREEHNRQIQRQIDNERGTIERLQEKELLMEAKLENLNFQIDNIKVDHRRNRLAQERSESSISSLQDNFWK